jgi:SAM-dependent methyltransferase
MAAMTTPESVSENLRNAEASDRARIRRQLPHTDPSGRGVLKIHPVELARRRKRCESMAGLLAPKLSEFVQSCNVCGSERSATIAQLDRYGVPSRTAMCLACGLIYQVDRLNDADADEFYASGDYRTLVSKFTDTGQGIEQNSGDQIRYARGLIRALSGHLRIGPKGHLLDIGGGAGRIAFEFQELLDMRATVLDPAADEVAAARRLGMEGITAPFEDWNPTEEYDLVLLCRSIEHVRNLKAVLSKMRRCLRPQGYAYCDFVDFGELCRLVGHPEAVTKIDHCFWLTQQTAGAIFRSAGFEIVSINLTSPAPLVGYLLRASKPSLLTLPQPTEMQIELRNLLRTTSEWNQWAATTCDSKDWLRRRAYVVKRRIQKVFESKPHA